MATLVNILKTIFTTEGAENATGQVNNLTKAYSRLGAETSNNTRRFSAWAQASGGIASTYAAAAAQVYALTAAYQALSSAANTMQLIEATKSYAAAVGTTGSQVINTLKEITNGQITMSQAAEAANLSLAAGFNVSQIEELVGGASRAARALGRDMTDSINRVIRGTIKLEPELLDELGVFLKLDDAVERYSQTTGKSANSLTNYEKRLAVLNEVTRQLKQNFDLITISNNTSAAAFQKFSTAFQDTLTKVGGIFAEAIAPILNFLSKDTGTILTTLTAIGLLVFSKLTSQLKELGTAVSGWGEGVSRRLVNLRADSTAVDAALAKMQQSSESFTGRLATGSRASNQAIKELRTSLEEGNMTLIKAAKAREDLNRAESAITTKRAPLTENEQKTLALVRDLRAGIDDYGKATVNANSAWVSGLERVANGFNFVLGLIGKIGRFLGYIGILLSAAQFLGAIFNVDILGTISDWWGKLFEKSKNLKAGLEGVAAASVNASKGLLEGYNQKKIDEIGTNVSSNLQAASQKALKDLRQQRSNIQSQVIDAYAPEATVPIVYTTKVEIEDKTLRTTVENIINSFSGLKTTVEGASVSIDTAVQNPNKFLLYQQQLVVKLTENYTKLADEAKKSGGDPAKAQKALEALIALKGAKLQPFAQLSGELGALLEIPFNKATEALVRFQDDAGNLSIGGKIFAQFNEVTGFFEQTNTDLAKLAVRSGDLFNTLTMLFKSGAGADKLGPSLKAAEDALKKIKEIGAEDISLKVNYDSFLAAYKAIEQAEQQINIIRKNYTKEIEIAQNARAQGYIDANGKIAKSDAEIQANRINYLNETVSKALDTTTQIETMAKASQGDLIPTFGVDMIGEPSYLVATEESIAAAKKQLEAAKVAAQAVLGKFLSMGPAMAEVNTELDLKITKLRDELSILEMQNSLAERRLQIQLAQTQQEGRIQNLQQEVKVQEVSLQQLQADINLRKAQIAAAKELNSAQQNLLSSQKQLLQSQYDLAQAQIETKYIAPQAAVQSKLAEAQTFSNLSTEKEIADLKIAAATLEYQKQLELLDIKQKQLDDQYKKDLEMNDLKMQAVKLDAAAKAAESQGQIDILKKQDEIRKANEQIEKEKIANQITNLAKQREILQQETNIAIAKAEADKKAREAELLLLEQKKSFQFKEIDLASKIAEQQEKYLNGLAQANRVEGFTYNVDKFKSDLNDLINSYTEINNKINTIRNLNGEIATITENSLKRQLTLQNDNITAQQNNLANQLNGIAQISALQDQVTATAIQAARASGAGAAEAIRAVEIERQAITTKYQSEDRNILNARQQQDLKYKEEIASILRTQDEMKKLFNGIAGVINNALNKGVDDLFEAMKNGTLTMQSFKQGVKDMFRNLAFDIQKEIFKQMTLKPITDWVSKQMNNLANMATEMITGVNPQSEAFKVFADNINKSLSGTGAQTVEVKGLQENIAAQTQLYQAVTGQGKPNLVTIAGQLAPVQVITAPGAAPLGGVAPPGTGIQATPATPWDNEPLVGGGDGFVDGGAWDQATQSAENAAASTNTLSGAFGSLGQGVTGLLGQLGPFGAIIGTVGKGLLSLLGFFGQALSSVISSIAGASAGGGGGLFGAIGNLFGGIFGGGTSDGGQWDSPWDSGGGWDFIENADGGIIRKMANGGYIRKMAAGGGVSLRDRVPTLLEPGEFVVRKPAVDNAGLPAMQRLNATGSTAPPPVKIDIQNQGTQKDAEQQGTPMFDGEAWVVKLILKDLRSNGPIRRGMRSGLG